MWAKVQDDAVRHVWQCTDKECECDHEEIYIDPSWYQDNGTPMCDVGDDMEYIRTEVDTVQAKKWF